MPNQLKHRHQLPADLTPMRLRRALQPGPIGTSIVRYETVTSTSDIVRARARAGAGEGLVVLAERQSAGRGRGGHRWDAPYGSALLCSLLLRPAWLAPRDAFVITMLAGVALCEAIERVAPVAVRLKWPNDAMFAGAKLAGILCDLDLAGGGAAAITVGIGVNVGAHPDGTVDGRDLARSATDLAAASGRQVDRGELAIALLDRLNCGYAALPEDRAALLSAWRGRLETIGRRTTVSTPSGSLTGLAEDVQPDGALLLRLDDGKLLPVYAGDAADAAPGARAEEGGE